MPITNTKNYRLSSLQSEANETIDKYTDRGKEFHSELRLFEEKWSKLEKLLKAHDEDIAAVKQLAIEVHPNLKSETEEQHRKEFLATNAELEPRSEEIRRAFMGAADDQYQVATLFDSLKTEDYTITNANRFRSDPKAPPPSTLQKLINDNLGTIETRLDNERHIIKVAPRFFQDKRRILYERRKMIENLRTPTGQSSSLFRTHGRSDSAAGVVGLRLEPSDFERRLDESRLRAGYRPPEEENAQAVEKYRENYKAAARAAAPDFWQSAGASSSSQAHSSATYARPSYYPSESRALGAPKSDPLAFLGRDPHQQTPVPGGRIRTLSETANSPPREFQRTPNMTTQVQPPAFYSLRGNASQPAVPQAADYAPPRTMAYEPPSPKRGLTRKIKDLIKGRKK